MVVTCTFVSSHSLLFGTFAKKKKVAKMGYLAPQCPAVSPIACNNSRTAELIFIKCYVVELYPDLSTHSICY